jgi:hypothetical protein
MSDQNPYKCFFPEDYEDETDAIEIRASDAEDAAYKACELDYTDRDGWERLKHGEGFLIRVVCPDATIEDFKGFHEPSIEHYVEKVVIK